MKLRIGWDDDGREFGVGPDALTQTFAILAKRGVGKTYTAAVLVEEFLAASLPVAIVDPIGVWWGLRLSADGKGPGYSVVVFGGEHGDLPLPVGAGKAIASLIAKERIPAIIDVSLMRKGEQRQFMTDFAETLYHENRQALHLVLDEADAWAPQRPVPGAERLLGAIEDIVRRGRARGLGVTMITQRPAVIHKDVLTQSEVLVALRLIHALDRKAIEEWVKAHGAEEKFEQLRASLPGLPVGTAWFWSPGWGDIFRRVKVRPRRTFDSSATPTAGSTPIVERKLSEIDLSAIEAQLAEASEEAKRNDPKRLHAEIARLEKDLAALRAKPEKPDDGELRAAYLRGFDEGSKNGFENGVTTASLSVAALTEQFQQNLTAAFDDLRLPHPITPAPEPTRRTPTPASAPAAAAPRFTPPAAPAQPSAATFNGSGGQARMLAVLASRAPIRLTRAQLGTLAKIKHTGGTFGTYLSRLRSDGLIAVEGDLLYATDAGIQAAGADVPIPRTPAEVLAMWKQSLGGKPAEMLDILVDRYPEPVTRRALADAVGLEPKGGTFGTYLSRLSSNRLVEKVGADLRAAAELVQ
jgi:hypothetical protein